VAENATESTRLLVVSREAANLRPLWAIAELNSWQIETAVNAWDAIERVQSGVTPDLLVLDFPRGDSDCLHILRWMRRLCPNLPVVVIFSAEDGGRKRDAIRLGAQEVLIRPFDEARLEASIQRYLTSTANAEVEIASEDIEQLGPDSFFVSASPITQKLRAQAELLAEADVPVLILGETGSGKDTVARLIHKLSVRSGFHFLRVNCADMPDDLLEVELFGSNSAAFGLGNGRTAPGKIARADKGTIFLDEIAEMPMSLQNRLMQILQNKVLSRPDGDKPVPFDVRILAATSASIDRALAQKKLREDLFYRLSAFTVHVPPLRQRRSEIPVLLQHAMHRLSRHYGLPPRDFSSVMIGACQQYSWPGNLKELESYVKRYLVAGNAELAIDGLNHGSSAGQPESGHVLTATERAASQIGAGVAERNESSLKSLKCLIQDVKWEAERNAIGTALQKTGWNRKAAARMLQVSYRTLLYKIDQYHMNTSESFAPAFSARKVPLPAPMTRSNGKG
jgi:two-component system, NtrC family, response regulator AtoC